MSPLLAALLTAVLFSPGGHGKTVAGLFKSESARQQNGQFITGFMYQGSVNDDGEDGGDGDCDGAQLSCIIKTIQDSNGAYNREYYSISVVILYCPSLSLLQTFITVLFILQTPLSNRVYNHMLNIHSPPCSICSQMNEFYCCPNGPTCSCVIFSFQVAAVVFWCAASRILLWLQRRSPGCCFTKTWSQTWTT